MPRDSAAPPPAVDLGAYAEIVGRTWPPAGETLPFARDQDVPDAVRAAWAEEKAKKASAAESGSDTSAATGDETAFLPSSMFTGPSTPFVSRADAPPTPTTSMEDYAAFLAELGRDPSREGFLRAKYGIQGEEAQLALGAAFASLFAQQPSERARFETLLARERARQAPPAAAVTPPSGRLPESLPASVSAMSLDQFAWLSAKLHATPPGELAAVLATLRLTDTTRGVLEAQWRARLAADPSLDRGFRELYGAHLARIAGAK